MIPQRQHPTHAGQRLRLCLLLSLLIVPAALCGQLPVPDKSGPAKDSMTRSLLVTATTSATVPHITLHWREDNISTVNSLSITRRIKGEGGAGTTLTPVDMQANLFADHTAEPGVPYEYKIIRNSNIYQEGSIVAGYNIPLIESRGNVVLLVDETMGDGTLDAMSGPLAPELTRLKQDLEGDGWTVYFTAVPRQQIEPEVTLADDPNSGAARLVELTTTLSAIQAEYDKDPTARWSLLIVGRVPQPYSGYGAIDGHSNHYGAWPTDRYYSSLGQGNWTDVSTATVQSKSTSDQRNWNIAGDGKFDQYYSYQLGVEADPVLEAGRVDLYNVNLPYGVSEQDFLRQYLNRDHAFRHGQAPYYHENSAGWHNAPSADQVLERRARIYEIFQYNFTTTAWSAAAAFFGNNTGQIDFLTRNTEIHPISWIYWFEDMATYPTLFGANAGMGNQTSSGGSGGTQTIWPLRTNRAVFHQFFGSYFGDFDYKADEGTPFLKAPLAGNKDSMGLINMWSGWPNYHLYHMALGETVGYSAKFSERHSSTDRFWNSNGTPGIWMNLLGNPTLRLHTVYGPVKPRVGSTAAGAVLDWTPSPDPEVAGYHVYRSIDGGPYTRLTGGAVTPNTIDTSNAMGYPITATTFTDTSAVSGTTYRYLVKAVKIETSASGTYVNQSVGEPLQITHNPEGSAPSAPTGFVVDGSATATYQLSWDSMPLAMSYEVERLRDVPGTWESIGSVSNTHFTDIVAVSDGVPRYRIRSVNDFGGSNYVYGADYNLPGLIYTAKDINDISNSRTYEFFERGQGTAELQLHRYNGSMGEVSVTPEPFTFLNPEGDISIPTDPIIWAHGDVDTKILQLTIPDNGPHLTKLFRIRYTNPTNGLVSQVPRVDFPYGGEHLFAVTDPSTRSLPDPWTSKTVGFENNIIYDGYSEYHDGTFGILTRTHMAVNGANDSMRILYRPVTGDFTMTARVKYTSNVMTPSIYSGIFVRSNEDNSSEQSTGSAIATLQVRGGTVVTDTDYTGKGLEANFRATNGGTIEQSILFGQHRVPYWLRIQRTGNLVEVFHSEDGVNWDNSFARGEPSATITDLGPTAYVGMLAAAYNSDYSNVDYPAYVQYDHVSVYQVPTVPSNLTAIEQNRTTAMLSWDAVDGIEHYLLQRSTSSGSGFITMATLDATETSYTDTGLSEGVTYYYRIRSANPIYGDSADSAEVSLTLSSDHTTTWNGWQEAFFTPAQTADPTVGGADADPDGDGLANLIEYALNLHPRELDDHDRRPSVSVENDNELVLIYRVNKAATELVYRVESSPDLITWTEESLSEELVDIDVDGDGKTELVKVRKNLSENKLFIRLNIIQTE